MSNTRTLTLGFSPCPNDTFIFAALVNGLIDTGDLRFEVQLADVEALNLWAMEGRLDVTKLSFHALGLVLNRYNLLDSGSALGRNCGPLIVAAGPLTAEQLEAGLIAIPGRYTTAIFC